MGLAIDCVNTVVTELNASGRDYTAAVNGVAQRVHYIDADLKSLGELHVRAYLAKRETDKSTRNKRKLSYAVEIGVQQKVQRQNLNAEADPLLNLSEQIADWFDKEDREITSSGGEKFRVTEVVAPLAPYYEHLVNHGVYTSLITLTLEKIAP